MLWRQAPPIAAPLRMCGPLSWPRCLPSRCPTATRPRHDSLPSTKNTRGALARCSSCGMTRITAAGPRDAGLLVLDRLNRVHGENYFLALKSAIERFRAVLGIIGNAGHGL